MEKIDKILKYSFTKKAVGRAARSAMVCFYAEKWGNHQMKAISYSGGILKLSADNSSQLMEIDMKKESLQKYLKEKTGEEVKIRLLRF